MQIVRNNDYLQPSKEQEDIALEKSRTYWHAIVSVAHVYLDYSLPPEFTNPQLSLDNVPKFRGGLKSECVRILGITPIFALCSTASSTWKLMENSDCNLLKEEITKPAWVQIGTASTIPYSFRGEVFSRWLGMTTETDAGPNYLGILAIGWCYVLSAKLVEMQGGGAVMRYTSSLAKCLSESPPISPEETHFIDIGEADERVIRWWSAILAKCEGWKAIVKDDTRDEFVAPWSGSRTCETSFTIKGKCGLSLVQEPLSSDDAFDALLEFTLLHNLGSQFYIALTIAMSFPMHRYYGTEVKLPLPKAHGGRTLTPDTTMRASALKQVKKDLPYYMTLSCSPEVMISTLCGSFWQPGIPCNMVSQWLHQVLEEALAGVEERKCQEIVALIGAIRRPNIGALWIGAAVSGIGPKLLEKIKRGRPPLDSNAFPWTGAPQSFMDVPGSGLYTFNHSEYISRPDVWRLLHLSPTEGDDLNYEHRPTTPWEPCGVSLATDCALRVTSHLKCPRHECQYDHWNWNLKNGENVQDYGFSKSNPSICDRNVELSDIEPIKESSHSFEKKELDPDREASEEASLEIFRWSMVGGEGLPAEKIYRDDLLQEMWEQLEDDADEPVDAEHRDPPRNIPKNKNQLEAWLDTIA